MDHPLLGRRSSVWWYMRCLDSLNWTLWVNFLGWYWYQSLIDGSNIWVCGKDRTLGSRNWPSAIGPQLFGSRAVVWYFRCLDFLNWTLWVRFHGWYWYLSFIDGSNIWGVDRSDPWGPEMYHPPLGRSYLEEIPSDDMWGALILLTGLYGWTSMAGIDINPSSMGPIFGGVERTEPWGPEIDHPPLGRSYLVVVPSYDISGALIFSTGLYGWDSMAGININPPSMGPIFGVWIGPTRGVPKWTVRYLASAIW